MVKPTILDGIVAFMVLFGVAVFLSRWKAGAFIAEGILIGLILTVLLRNTEQLAGLEQNTLKKLGT